MQARPAASGDPRQPGSDKPRVEAGGQPLGVLKDEALVGRVSEQAFHGALIIKLSTPRQSGRVPAATFAMIDKRLLDPVKNHEHDECEQCGETGDLPEAEARCETNGTSQPHSRAGGKSLHLAAREDDGARGEKGYAGGHCLDEADRIEAGGFRRELIAVDDLYAEQREARRRDRDEDMGAKARRMSLPFPLESHHRAKERSEQEPESDGRKAEIAGLTDLFQ